MTSESTCKNQGRSRHPRGPRSRAVERGLRLARGGPQDARRRASPAARRRDRARRVAAWRRTGRDRDGPPLPGVAHARARGDPSTGSKRADRVARPSRLDGGAPEQRATDEMFEAMAELEALCAKIAAERMTTAERSALEAVHEELRPLVRMAIRSATTRSTRPFTRPSMPAPTTTIWPSSHRRRECACSRSGGRNSAISAGCQIVCEHDLGRGRDPARRSRRRRTRDARPHHDRARGIRSLRAFDLTARVATPARQTIIFGSPHRPAGAATSARLVHIRSA